MSARTYSEKLRDPRWQRKRLEILNASNFTCQDCGAKEKPLHVHHCLYISGREPWEYSASELRVVCDECHEGRGQMEKDCVEELRRLFALLSTQEICIVGAALCCAQAFEGTDQELIKWMHEWAWKHRPAE